VVVAIDLNRVPQDRVNTLPLSALKTAIEAASAPCVTSDAARLLHFQQYNVGVAIEPDLDNRLAMTG